MAHLKYESLPEVTLSSPAGTGEKTSIPVLNQRSYTGRKPVIPSTLADTPCADLAIGGLLERLNTTLGTSYTLFTPWVYSVLGDCILEDYDFGTAYARLRPFWYDLSTMVDDILKREVRHRKMMKDVLVNDRIIQSFVPPRRVWDLYSNRVVPWWVARRWPWGISHSWMNQEDREDVLTPINGREWPAPIPKDISLDLVRIEMLDLGAEYVWLDVLCLRQKGGCREDLRDEEWKVDVPTIGQVYEQADKVVCYLSGLGRPLTSKADDFESDRCWFKRAWTLQEISWDPIIGGDTGDEELRARFEKQLSSLRKIHGEQHMYDVLSQMQKRVSTNPVDRVAGMAYLLESEFIPAYYGEQSEEDAWTALVDVTLDWCQEDLLFLYPKPGNGTKSWRPSWKQVMTEKLPAECPWLDCSDQDNKTDIESYHNGYIIESAFVRGLFEGDFRGQERRGELVVEDRTGTECIFEIIARHQYPIPDGSYTLLGTMCADDIVLCWVVGWRLPDQRLKKLSVFEMYEENTESLSSKGITTKAHTTFLA
ncbi:hypothetical protein DFS33DRAFT_1363873 [Desarmillaria ectypa]|nr:hypothetical protein DFS33DRAFT_1363873 [Desarmillaria ectypa]